MSDQVENPNPHLTTTADPNYIAPFPIPPGEHPMRAWLLAKFRKREDNARPREVPFPATASQYPCPSLSPITERAGDLAKWPEVIALKAIQDQWDRLQTSANGLSVEKVLEQRRADFEKAIAEGGDLGGSEMPNHEIILAECTRKWQAVQSAQSQLFNQASPLIRAINSRLARIAAAMSDEAAEAIAEIHNLYGVSSGASTAAEQLRSVGWHLEEWLKAAERTTPRSSPRATVGHYLPL